VKPKAFGNYLRGGAAGRVDLVCRERRYQWLQVAFIYAPAAEPTGVDRLADLRATHRTHLAVLLEEALASRVVRQAEEVKHSMQRASEILDPVFEMQG
jgi:hypothetical protein